MAERGRSWLATRTRRRGDAGAGAGLYCFPHAGGGPGEYVRWADGLPGVRVWAVRPPDRRPTRMAELVDGIVSAVIFEPPYAFFGHSLGALVAFEVARALGERGPERLIVSGCPAPFSVAFSPDLHLLRDRDLLAEVERRWGAMPAEVRVDPELLASALGIFRADLEVLETYRFVPGTPLAAPITAITGEDDINGAHMGAWREHTLSAFDLHVFPGGHFYFRERRREVLHLVHDLMGGDG